MEESSSTTKTFFLAAFVFLSTYDYAGPQVYKAEDFVKYRGKEMGSDRAGWRWRAVYPHCQSGG